MQEHVDIATRTLKQSKEVLRVLLLLCGHISSDLRTIPPRPYYLKVPSSPHNTFLCLWEHSGSSPSLSILAYFISTFTSYPSVVSFSRLLRKAIRRFYQIPSEGTQSMQEALALCVGVGHKTNGCVVCMYFYGVFWAMCSSLMITERALLCFVLCL